MARSRLRGLIVPTILTLAGLTVLVSLGNWQLHRLAWKEDLIARVAERPSAAPVDLRRENLEEIGEPSSFLERNEYRTAILSGEYEPSSDVLAFTSVEQPKGPLGGPGYWVMTPLITPPSGATIFVNRGFVPQTSTHSYAPPPAGQVTIRGLIRASETGSWLTPDPDIAKRIFYARNLFRIGQATGSRQLVGFFIDLERSETPASGLPQAGETMMTFTNNHLQYAVTWYGLGLALLAVFAVYARGQLALRDKKPA